MSARDSDDVARATLANVRGILRQLSASEMATAPTGQTKRALAEFLRLVEGGLRRYEISADLVTIADPAARAQFETLTPRSETVAARAAACVQEQYGREDVTRVERRGAR